MKKSLLKKSILIIIFSLVLINPIFAESDEEPEIEIEVEYNETSTISIGDTVQLYAQYYDTSETIQDKTFDWTISPDSLGKIITEQNSNYLVAQKKGELDIVAKINNGDLADTSSIYIYSDDKDDGDDEDDEIDDEDGDDEDDEEEGESEEDIGSLPNLVISPSIDEIKINETIDFYVTYIDTNRNRIDTTSSVSWQMDESIGTFENNRFVANSTGESEITVTLDSLSKSFELEVEEQEESEEEKDNEVERDEERDEELENLEKGLKVFPEDTTIEIGSEVDFSFTLDSSSYSLSDTSQVNWKLNGMDIGVLSTDGFFQADSTGFALVEVTVDNKITGVSRIIVEDSTRDENINNIKITRNSTSNPDKQITLANLQEGEAWTIGGFHPVLNGGVIYFPKGSLDEDIRINLALPDFAEMREETGEIEFDDEDGILSGIEFQVYVNDTLHQGNYYFNSPLMVSLVYKRGLLDEMDIAPTSLGLYFVENDSSSDKDILKSEGIKNATLDYFNNRIYSSVEHFSTLAVKGEQNTTAIEDTPNNNPSAKNYKLYNNYPNPFNPSTNIRFDLPKKSNVDLSVYNILGQKVETLVSSQMTKGTHRIKWNAANLSSGVYFIRIKAGNFTKVQKTMLLK